MKDLGHWITCLTIPEEAYGFIYMITNLVSNKKYIGKKQMVSRRTKPPLKGKKRKRICMVESDWKTYVSSSNELVKDIETLGKENFKFEILRFCANKSQLAYYEAKEQFDREVLMKEDYYNGIINLRLGKVKL
jgi:spermidine/putrescine-binding protein